MIGAILLIIGLLLVLAGLAAARIPGGAAFARPGISSRARLDPVRAFVLAPIHPTTWYANGAIAMGLFTGLFGFAFVAALASAGLSVLVAGIGIVLIAAAIEAARIVAGIERRRAFLGETVRPPAHPYKPLRGGGFVGLLRALFADESRWRDVLYVAVNLPLALIEFIVVLFLWGAALALLTMPVWFTDVAPSAPPVGFLGAVGGLLLLPVAASASQLVIGLHRAVVSGLLCTSEARELRRQVETLRESRSAVLDVEASELHRIERDLHDGAQQRLVMLNIDLGLASERIDSDPAAAKVLILEGQEQARQALAEIRDLVRGIAPSILLDRGVVAAVESIAARGPVPTSLVSELEAGERFAPAVERTAYFVISEALANVAKHSGATHCEVRFRRDAGRLVVEVWDDGAGGAHAEPGGGLEGLASRVAGIDGTFSVSSPDGGPTTVRAALPVANAAAVPEGGA